MTTMLQPRGTKVSLPHGGLPEIYPPYLADLISSTGGPDGPIGRQFIAQPEKERKFASKGVSDPFFEEQYEVAPGLVYKFKGRALWIITRQCAAYCRFCMRGRQVGMTGFAPHLLMDQLNKTLSFIEDAQGMNEIILSGGDPLTIHPKILRYVLEKLGELQKREITDCPDRHACSRAEILYELFTKLAAEGVVPYYLCQNDPVYWAKHFTVPLPKAIALWQKLRPMLSGIAAIARFTIEAAGSYEKIPVPEGDAWVVDYAKGFKDFHGTHFFMECAEKKK